MRDAYSLLHALSPAFWAPGPGTTMEEQVLEFLQVLWDNRLSWGTDPI